MNSILVSKIVKILSSKWATLCSLQDSWKYLTSFPDWLSSDFLLSPSFYFLKNIWLISFLDWVNLINIGNLNNSVEKHTSVTHFVIICTYKLPATLNSSEDSQPFYSLTKRLRVETKTLFREDFHFLAAK